MLSSVKLRGTMVADSTHVKMELLRSNSTRSLGAIDNGDNDADGPSAKDFLLNAANTRLQAAFDGPGDEVFDISWLSYGVYSSICKCCESLYVRCTLKVASCSLLPDFVSESFVG